MGKLITPEQFQIEFDELANGEYVLLEPYVNSRTRIHVLHKACGHDYYVFANDFRRGNRCAKCRGVMQKDTETFKREVYDLVGDEYTVLGEYVNNHTHVLMRHNECGHEFLVRPNKFLSKGTRCPQCNAVNIRTADEFEELFYQIVDKDEYQLLSKFTNTRAKIRILHKKCGTEFEMKVSNFLFRGSRCPNCYNSRGENIVKATLDDIGATYQKEYKIPECKRVNPLPFDFALLDGDELKGLIEYDGEQHYKPVDFFGGEERFAYRQENDGIKTGYCKEHNIPLLRIPYSDRKDEAIQKIKEFVKMCA